jgi:hypothetical protein
VHPQLTFGNIDRMRWRIGVEIIFWFVAALCVVATLMAANAIQVRGGL